MNTKPNRQKVIIDRAIWSQRGRDYPSLSAARDTCRSQGVLPRYSDLLRRWFVMGRLVRLSALANRGEL